MGEIVRQNDVASGGYTADFPRLGRVGLSQDVVSTRILAFEERWVFEDVADYFRVKK